MKVILTSVPIDYILQISRAICGNSESEICTILANLTDGLGAAIAFNPLIDYLRETYKVIILYYIFYNFYLEFWIAKVYRK